MSYKYDVFLSYKKNPVTNPWVTMFEKKLKFWLTQDLGGREPLIFFDNKEIGTGEIWQTELIEAIKGSKCLLCIWTPEYFGSTWCTTEWLSFEDRESYFNKGSLILPVRFHDGEHYPKRARDRQWHDVSEYNYTVESFWDSPKAIGLEGKIKELSKELSNSIKTAPPYKDGFQVHLVDENELKRLKDTSGSASLKNKRLRL